MSRRRAHESQKGQPPAGSARPDERDGGRVTAAESVRRAELADSLASVRDRITRAALDAGRAEDAVTLVVVTKTFPASDVATLADLGVRDIGENRHPEARDKCAAVGRTDLRWHFVGQLQSNKAAAVARYADVVHSVTSRRVVARLSTGATEAGRLVDCLLQLSLDPPTAHLGRAGVDEAAVARLAAEVDAAPGLRLRGLMGVAPVDEDPVVAFDRLAAASARLRAEFPAAEMLSAGMSGDLEAAVRAGATHVRIGRAILGTRPSLR